MQIMKRTGVVVMVLLLWFAGTVGAARVVTENDRVYIEDRTGERWDVTQAQELGFIAQRFQYGIGKNAFVPLGDKDFTEGGPTKLSTDRIIGVVVDEDAHAYAVSRLRRHEIANTTIAGKAIVAGY